MVWVELNFRLTHRTIKLNLERENGRATKVFTALLPRISCDFLSVLFFYILHETAFEVLRTHFLIYYSFRSRKNNARAKPEYISHNSISRGGDRAYYVLSLILRIDFSLLIIKVSATRVTLWSWKMREDEKAYCFHIYMQIRELIFKRSSKK